MASTPASQRAGPGLKQELGLGDLVLAQVLCVVGSSFAGISAKVGRAHVIFWLVAMSLFYVPLAVVVIHLNRRLPLEGGLYQWAKAAFGEAAGFLIAWNLWVYAVIATAAVVFVVPTDLGYLLGGAFTNLGSNRAATLPITAAVLAVIVLVAWHGLDIGKWLHNIGSGILLLVYAIVIALPVWALARGSIAHYEPFPIAQPKLNLFSLSVLGQMTVGALSGFEYMAILAGECRSAARNIGRSVAISAPIIALIFVLGTSSVLTFVGTQPINVIGPIPQTMRLAFGATSWVASFTIFLVLVHAIAGASLIFTGITRLPMAAGWDNLVPAWFARLHPVHRTPVNSILTMAVLVMALVVLSMRGVHEQESWQLLVIGSVAHYAIAYIALFAIPLSGAIPLPRWLKPVALVGLLASVLSLCAIVYPVVNVVSKWAYAARIIGVVMVANLAGVGIYRAGRRRAHKQ